MGNIELLGREYLFEFKKQSFVLDAEKAIFWENESTLIISDVHLGKAGHFRKNGIPVPRTIHLDDYQRMNLLIEKYQPKIIVFLGDLFHSEPNDEWNDLVYWSNYHADIEQILVEGNHDKLTVGLYHETAMRLVDSYQRDAFEFTHESRKSVYYNISGHIHPAVKVSGLGRQSQNLSCFHFGKSYGVMPAFGKFTGTHLIKGKPEDEIFAVAEDEIIGIIV